MEYAEKVYMAADGFKIAFTDNEVKSKKLLIIFPPGICTASVVYEIGETFETQDYRIIALSYPSRGKSARLKTFDSFEKIVDIIYPLIRDFHDQFNEIYFVGISFGTAVATIITQKYFNGDDKIKIILINGGEYINQPLKFIFDILFIPALISNKYAQLMYRLLRFVVKAIHFPRAKDVNRKNFPVSRLRDIDEQWISTLNYKIDTTKPIYNKINFIIGSHDLIIKKDSINKLISICENKKIYIYEGKHIMTIDSEDGNKIIQFVKKILF